MTRGLRTITLVLPIFWISSSPLDAQAPTHSSYPNVSYKDLKFPPLGPVRTPKIETFTLANGLKVFLLEDHELPLLRGTAIVRTGNLFDPADKVGLATVTGTAIRSGGTTRKSGDDLDIELEDVAASVESEIGESVGTVSFSALKENSDQVLGIFCDVLTTPGFRQEKIDFAKSQLRSGIARRNDDPQGIAEREFASAIYGHNNSYGWQIEYATLDKISRDDVVKFYERYFFPANVMLAVHGDFDAPAMKSKLEKLFGGWNVTQAPVPAFPEVEKNETHGAFLATKADVTQTTFILGFLGGTLRDKDYPALTVLADILGGGFRSRLLSKIRTDLGYAYDISADWAAQYDHPGLFEISAATKSVSTTEALQAVLAELDRIRHAEVTNEELDSARQAVLNSFVFKFDTPAKILNRMILYRYYGYPEDFTEQHQKAVAALTRGDILRVAKQYLDPNRFTLVAVGNPKDFGKPLTDLGMPVKALDISIPEPKPQIAPQSAVTLSAGKALFSKMQGAAGGAEKLAAVRDYQDTVELQVSPEQGGAKIPQGNWWLAGGYLRQENTLPSGKVTIYSDGKDGWVASPQGAGALPEAQIRQVREELFRNYYTLLLSDRTAGRKLNLVGENILEITDATGNSVRVTANPVTALIEKLNYTTISAQGKPTNVEERMEDYRELGAIQTPFTIRIQREGATVATARMKERKLNTGLSEKEIGQRP